MTSIFIDPVDAVANNAIRVYAPLFVSSRGNVDSFGKEQFVKGFKLGYVSAKKRFSSDMLSGCLSNGFNLLKYSEKDNFPDTYTNATHFGIISGYIAFYPAQFFNAIDKQDRIIGSHHDLFKQFKEKLYARCPDVKDFFIQNALLSLKKSTEDTPSIAVKGKKYAEVIIGRTLM